MSQLLALISPVNCRQSADLCCLLDPIDSEVSEQWDRNILFRIMFSKEKIFAILSAVIICKKNLIIFFEQSTVLIKIKRKKNIRMYVIKNLTSFNSVFFLAFSFFFFTGKPKNKLRNKLWYILFFAAVIVLPFFFSLFHSFVLFIDLNRKNYIFITRKMHWL